MTGAGTERESPVNASVCTSIQMHIIYILPDHDRSVTGKRPDLYYASARRGHKGRAEGQRGRGTSGEARQRTGVSQGPTTVPFSFLFVVQPRNEASIIQIINDSESSSLCN